MKRLFGVALGVAACTGCGVRLDEPAPAPEREPEAPIAAACRPFQGTGVVRLGGRLDSVALGDGTRLFIAGSARIQDGSGARELQNAGFIAPDVAPDPSSGCFGDATLLDHPVLASDALVRAFAAVRIGEQPVVYFARYEPVAGDPFPQRVGIGVARWDSQALRFVPSQNLLWTGDRPSFGGGAVVDGGEVFAYGCLPGEFLSHDCYLARAPAESVDDEAAYGYYSGGGQFDESLENAFSIFEAGDPTSVAHVPGKDRFLAAYVPPLGSAVWVRSGLGAAGPFSGARAALGCELPEDAFGGDAVVHEIAGELYVTYGIGSFTPGASDADPLGYWTRLTRLKVPAELP
ncbi:MAG: hypothetical protein U0263_22435 [Polyangiaceae bacterium]